jgi:hypothetical protein
MGTNFHQRHRRRGGTLRVTLTATNGVLSLGSLTGLSFTTGNGVTDATMTFTGTLASINNALDGPDLLAKRELQRPRQRHHHDQ